MRVYSDGIKEWQLGFQTPATAISESIIKFHNDLMLLLVFVVVFVGFLLFRTVWHFRSGRNKVVNKNVHGTVIEVVWTVIPAVLLMIVGIPSFTLLYGIDEVIESDVTVKVVGNQWYWSYEYSDVESEVEFDSYMINDDELKIGELRLLEVDNRLVLPVEKHIRLIVTASDVLHSFAVPSFGVKVDGVPGRLNEVSTYVKRLGVYYGQCSELCGVNHSFMPICVEVVSVDDYIKWLSEKA